MSQANRLGWIDYARGIAIIMVVYRHAYEGIAHMSIGTDLPYWSYILQESVYNLRMPMFFIVAGMFVRSSFRKRGMKLFIRYKWETVLYPYLIWTIIQVGAQIVAAPYTNYPMSWVAFLDILYNPRALMQFWFLYALFAINVLYVSILHYGNSERRTMIGVGLLLFVAGAYVNTTLFSLADIFFFLLYFAIGDALAPYLLDDENARRIASLKVTAVLLPTVLIAQTIWLAYYMGVPAHSAMDLKGRTVYLLVSIFGEALILQIAFLLAQKNIADWLRYVGSHSLYIYVMHFLVVSGIRIAGYKLLGIDHALLLLALAVIGGIGLPILFYQLSRNTILERLFVWQPQAA
jgi:fucose 4-O-acetylase-like acetyltransferase